MVIEKSYGTKYSIIKSAKLILVGSLTGTVACGILLCLFALLFSSIKMINAFIASIVCVLIISCGAFIGGYITAKISEQKGMFYGITTASVLFLITLLGSVSVTNEAFTFLSLVKFFAMLLSGAFGGIIGVNKKGR